MIVQSLDARQKRNSAKHTLDQLSVAEMPVMRAQWEKADDCFAGEDAVKAKWQKYISVPSSKRQGNGARKSTAAYIRRGKFPSFAADTLEQSIGILSSAEPEIRLEGKAETLTYLRDYCTSQKDGITGLFSRTVQNVLRYGRYCLLLQPNEEGANFHIEEIRPDKFLRAVPFDEDNEESYAKAVFLDTSRLTYDTKRWKEVFVPQITLLALDGAGNYYSAKFGNSGIEIAGRGENEEIVFDNAGMKAHTQAMSDIMSMLEVFDIDNPQETLCTEMSYPDKYGIPFQRIPFTCINGQDLNFMRFGSIPLMRLCNQCLHILNADCDHQNALYLTTDPKLVIIGGDGQEMPFRGGSDFAAFLPEGYACSFISPNGASLAAQKQNIDEMKDEARKMGVSLAGTESAAYTPGVSLELLRNAQTAALKTINRTIGYGIEEQLRYAGQWIGMSDEEIQRDISFVPSDAFAEIKATVQECVMYATNADALQITPEEVRAFLQRNDKAPIKEWKDVQAELDAVRQEKHEDSLNSARDAFGFSDDDEEEPQKEPKQKDEETQGGE